LILVGAISIPWIIRQWHEYQIRACQRNLAMFWRGLWDYSKRHEGAFPPLDTDGPRSFAGIVVPVLNDQKLLDREASVLCPAVGNRRPDPRSVRDLDQLWEHADRREYLSTMRNVGGSYAYPLGYWEAGRLVGMHRDMNDAQPILADLVTAGDVHANS